MKDQLLQKIADRTATVGVVGLGYVGLPLAMEFAKAGFRVIGYDVSRRVVDLLNAGESHIQDVPAADVGEQVRAGRFTASYDEARLGDGARIGYKIVSKGFVARCFSSSPGCGQRYIAVAVVEVVLHFWVVVSEEFFIATTSTLVVTFV